jgi:hypothetical protein
MKINSSKRVLGLRLLGFILAISGIVGILSAVIITPEFATNYISADNFITPEGYKNLSKLRLFSLLIGCLLLVLGFLSFKFPGHTQNFINRPMGTLLILIFGWIVIAFINFVMKKVGLNTGTPIFFPFSEFYGPRIHFSGLPYTVLFLIAFFIALKYSKYFNIFHVWLVGLTLIVLGNLAQGGLDEAFYKPFNAPFYYLGVPYYHQYYHDAIQIADWREWLSSFNANQPELTTHAKVHPPFAVLLHYLILNLGGHNLLILACSFILLSSLSIILVFQIMRSLELTTKQSSQFALLFSVIPAFNIYSAASLDGIIVSSSSIFLLGMVKIVRKGVNLPGLLLFIGGILLTNLLTFGIIILLAIAGLVTLREGIINKKGDMVLTLSISLLLLILTDIIILRYLGYDHIQAFLTASRLENPQGFRLFHEPLIYVMTRIENISEIMIFLSFGVLALLFHSDYLRLRICNLQDNINSIFLAGVISLLLAFLAGAFKTGETARSCLFIYPYFLLVLRNLEESMLRLLIIIAGLQTIIMQTFGGYFW